METKKIFVQFVIILLGVITLVLAFQSSSYAQYAPSPSGLQTGINFIIGTPKKEFSDVLGKKSYGISGWIGYDFKYSPLLVGLELSYLEYGRRKREEPFNSNIPDVIVDVTTTNSIFMGHTFLRIQNNYSYTQPYIEGLLGFKYLFTRTSVSDDNDLGQEFCATTNCGDIAWSYGYGAGVKFTVWDNFFRRKNTSLSEIVIDLHVRYLYGSTAEYLRKDSMYIQGGEVFYDVYRSRTDMLTYQIGVNFNF